MDGLLKEGSDIEEGLRKARTFLDLLDTRQEQWIKKVKEAML
jgi:hypothetical protein